MDIIEFNIEPAVEIIRCQAHEQLDQLEELQLALVGGGCGETVFD